MESRIRGLLPQDICNNGFYCEESEECGKKHPDWDIDYCPLFLKGEKHDSQHCQSEHISWVQLQREIGRQDPLGTQSRITQSQSSGQPREGSSPYQNKGLLQGSKASNVKEFGQESNAFKDPTMQEEIHSSRQEQEISLLSEIKMLGSGDQEQSIERMRTLEIVLIMDCSGSMRNWMGKVQVFLKKLNSKIEEKQMIQKVRIALVTYRDSLYGEQHIATQDFTDEISLVIKQVEDQAIIGEENQARDCVGGLKEGLKLSYTKDAFHCFFLLAQAPCHGKSYCFNIVPDQYPYKHEGQPLENVANQYQSNHPNSYFTCFKLNDSTDRMYKIMKQYIQNLNITPIENFWERLEFIFSSINEKTEIQEKKLHDSFFCQEQQISADMNVQRPLAEPNHLDMRNNLHQLTHSLTIDATCLEVQLGKLPYNQNEPDYWTNFDKQYRIYNIQTELVIQIECLARTDEYDTYLAHDKRRNQEVIIRVTKKNLNRKEQRDYANEIQGRYAMAAQITRYFRRECARLDKAPPLYCLCPVRYELKQEFNQNTHVFAEPQIDIENECYREFSSGQYQDWSQIIRSLTHFSHEYTGKVFLLTALKCKAFVIIEPVIHSEDLQKSNDPKNEGFEDFKKFYEGQHKKCTQICDRLELERPKNFAQHVGPYIQCLEMKSSVPVLCTLCKKISEIDRQRYLEMVTGNSQDIICHDCDQMSKQSIKEKECPYCQTTFHYPQHYYKVLGYEEPRGCKPCTKPTQTRCRGCNRDGKLSQKLLNDLTQNGKFAYFCKGCVQKNIYIDCSQCKQKQKSRLHLVDKSKVKNRGEFVCEYCEKCLQPIVPKCNICGEEQDPQNTEANGQCSTCLMLRAELMQCQEMICNDPSLSDSQVQEICKRLQTLSILPFFSKDFELLENMHEKYQELGPDLQIEKCRTRGCQSIVFHDKDEDKLDHEDPFCGECNLRKRRLKELKPRNDQVQPRREALHLQQSLSNKSQEGQPTFPKPSNLPQYRPPFDGHHQNAPSLERATCAICKKSCLLNYNEMQQARKMNQVKCRECRTKNAQHYINAMPTNVKCERNECQNKVDYNAFAKGQRVCISCHLNSQKNQPFISQQPGSSVLIPKPDETISNSHSSGFFQSSFVEPRAQNQSQLSNSSNRQNAPQHLNGHPQAASGLNNGTNQNQHQGANNYAPRSRLSNFAGQKSMMEYGVQQFPGYPGGHASQFSNQQQRNQRDNQQMAPRPSNPNQARPPSYNQNYFSNQNQSYPSNVHGRGFQQGVNQGNYNQQNQRGPYAPNNLRGPYAPNNQ